MWASPKDFSNELILNDTQDKITDLAVTESKLRFVEVGSVLMVVRSGILLHTLPVMVCGERMTVNQDIKVFSFSSEILPEYFVEYLKVYEKRILRLITKHSTTVQSVNTPELETFSIPLPPIEKQKELVAEMEAAREARLQKLAEAETLLSSLDGWLLEQLGITPQPKDNRKTFAIKLRAVNSERLDSFYYRPVHQKIEEQLKTMPFALKGLGSQLAFSPLNGFDARNYQETGQRYLRVQNIKPYRIDATDAKYVNVSTEKNINLKVGDVLLTRKGTFGISAPVTEEFINDIISSEVILLRLAENADVSTNFLVYWLNSSFAQLLFNRLKTGGIMGHITQSVVESFPVPIVDNLIQEKISQKFKDVRNEATRLRIEAEKLWQAAKDKFEAQLLRGE